MAPYLLPFFSFATAILGFLAFFILFFNNRNGNSFSNRLLGVSVLGMVLPMVLLTLMYTDLLLEVPHFYRISSPFTYLIAPFAYLYVRSLLYQEIWFRPYDWIHLLPFGLHALELIPFFLLSAEEKRALLEILLNQKELMAQFNEGILPPYAHQMAKTGIGLIYMIANYRLLLPDLTGRRLLSQRLSKPLLGWLFLLTNLLTINSILIFMGALIHRFPVNTHLVINITLATVVLSLLLILFLKPSVLYGLPSVVPMTANYSHGSRAKEKQLVLTEEERREYSIRIERHFQTNRPFLKKRYALTDLAEETGIPRHQLSACINQCYRTNFNDFINRHRIEYLLGKVDPKKWETLSIGGISQEIGFNTRTTFLKAFKKQTGMNPSEYRAKLLGETSNS